MCDVRMRLRLSAGVVFASLVILLGTGDAQSTSKSTPVPKPDFIPVKDGTIRDSVKSGKKKPDASTKPAFITLAKNKAYGLAHFPADGAETSPEGKLRRPSDETATIWIEDFMRSYYSIPIGRPVKPIDAVYLREVAAAMDPELKFVFEKDPRTSVKLNAVRFLAELGRGPAPSLAPTFLGIINEKLYSEAFKNYAYQGLQRLLVQKDPEELDRPLIADPKPLAEIAKALELPVAGKNYWVNQPPEVVQFIRRNAVAALGAVPYGVVRIRREEILARPVLPLFKILVADPSIQPPPSLAERTEALIGIASQSIDDSVNLDVLAYGLNLAMLDISTAHGEQAAAKYSTLPWKYTGARLTAAIETLTKNGKLMKNDRKPEWIRELVDRLKSVAADFEANGTGGRPEVGPLSDWALNRKPENTQLLSDVPESAFKLVK